MLSFELSAIDVVLMIAVVVLLLLFLTQRKGPSATKSESAVTVRKNPLEAPAKTAEEEHPKTRSSTDFQKCVHHFGYLRNLPKNSPVPDECFGCPKVLRCLFPNEYQRNLH